MKTPYKLLSIILIILVVTACKNETKEAVTPTTPSQEKAAKKLDSESKKIVSSVLMRAMTTKELKTYVGYLIAGGLTDTISKGAGPFTLLAPSNEAFLKLDKKAASSIFQVKNQEVLYDVVKNHIVIGDLNSVTLVDQIKNNNGKYTMTTLGGKQIVATRDDMNIVFTDANGKKAMLGKSDIKGDNGVVHVIDTLLWAQE